MARPALIDETVRTDILAITGTTLAISDTLGTVTMVVLAARTKADVANAVLQLDELLLDRSLREGSLVTLNIPAAGDVTIVRYFDQLPE